MSVPFYLRGLIAALQFLTRLPTPKLCDFSPEDQRAATAWYPVVGLLIGGIVAVAMVCGVQVSPWVAALSTLVAWIWVTGALHLDGLADVADGLGAAHGKTDRFLDVVKDPHIGSFGAVALFLLLIAKIVLLAEISNLLPPIWLPALVLIPAWARWGPLVWRTLVPPLGDGRGHDFAEHKDWTWAALYGALLAGVSFWLAPALLAALVICPAIALYWRWRLGGMSGDCHGAGIEIVEVLLLASLVVSAA